MRRLVALAASLALLLGVAAPAAASPPERLSWLSGWASTTFVTSEDPYAPGPFMEVEITFATGRWQDHGLFGDGDATFSQIDIRASGYTNLAGGPYFNSPWQAGYTMSVTPGDPTLGYVDPSLRGGWAEVGPMAYYCYTGPCPSWPATITVSAAWTATGPQVVTPSHPVDDIGGVSSMVARMRPAAGDFHFTGGTLTLPPVVKGSSIWYQQQVYRAPTP
jgi:hypothetical protein